MTKYRFIKFEQGRIGPIQLSVETALDSAVLERFLLPALIFQSTMHWGERGIGHAQMGYSLVVSFWAWSVRIKWIVYDLPKND